MTVFNLDDAAGDTLVHVHNALHQVAATLVDRTRPTQFRTIMQVDNSPLDYQLGIERHFVTSNAEWKWVQGHSSEVAHAEAQASQGVSPLVAAQSGYFFTNLELKRNVEAAVPLPQARANAVMTKAQSFLETVAAFGGLASNLGSQLRGLYNVVDHDGTNPTAADTTAGGTITGDWGNSGTDNAEIFADFMFIEDLAMTKAKDTEMPDSMVLPRSASLPFRSKNNTNTDRIVQEKCLEGAQSIRRIVYWVKGNAAAITGGPGVSAATRTIVANFANQDVVRMVIAQEPGPDGEAFRTPTGFYQPFHMVTGGVLSDTPDGITTADGI